MDAIKTGGLIAQVRREKELTQKDLAGTLHVSEQAVSKWERGLSCPDIGLLEPLAEALDLTVTELLSGQRGEEPKEETVRGSLRFGLEQLGPKIRRWKWLFILTAVLLLALLIGLGYLWVRDNTELLPQRETVLTPIELEEQQNALVDLLGNQGGRDIVRMFRAVLADDTDSVVIRAELWTFDAKTGRYVDMVQSWDLMNLRDMQAEDQHRRQLLAFRLTMPYEGGLQYRVRLGGTATSGPGDQLEGFPCPIVGMGWGEIEKPLVVNREDGAELLRVSMTVEGETGPACTPQLLVKMYCQ